MGIIKLFFLLPTKGKFLQNFAENDQLRNQANQFWQKLDDISLFLLLLSILIGIGLAAYYYTGYNNLTGRHYKIKYWSLWFFIAIFSTFVITLILEYCSIDIKLKPEYTSLYWMCALNNSLYCLVFYFLTSLCWCNFGRTNAYKFLKF